MKKKAVLENVRLSRAQINAAEHRLKRMNSSDSFKTETDMDKVSEENIESISSLDDLAVEQGPDNNKRRGGLSRMVSLFTIFLNSYKIGHFHVSLISSIHRTFNSIENLTHNMDPRNLRRGTKVVT